MPPFKLDLGPQHFARQTKAFHVSLQVRTSVSGQFPADIGPETDPLIQVKSTGCFLH